jgi:hypothetical protein
MRVLVLLLVITRNNTKIEDMNMAKLEWWALQRCAQSINMAFQSEKLPFMLVRTSKVIEMRFRDWPNERGYVRVKSQLVLNSRERFLIHQPNFEIIKLKNVRWDFR